MALVFVVWAQVASWIYIKPLDVSSASGLKRSIKSQSLTTSIPVFYNLYIGNSTDVERVTTIATEQLAFRDLQAHHPVFVNSIGYNTTLPGTIQLNHYKTEGEKVTLQALWEYCHNHMEQKVVYLHSKGSFTNTPENAKLRIFLTAGALSQDCQNMPDDDSCNVCSSRFSPLPHPHTSGNMWMAECSYVAKLLPPATFAIKMRKFKDKGSPACTGRMRWAAEHWIHSHPGVKPCDLYTSSTFLHGYKRLPSPNEYMVSSRKSKTKFLSPKLFSLAKAPRFDYDVFAASKICESTGVGTLQDRLEEYEILYKDQPDETWWGWKFWNTSADASS
jgi:hypothetical protein